MYLYSDVLIVVYVRCQVPIHSILPYMKTVIYSYLTFAQTLLHGNSHSFTAVYTQ